MDSIDYSYKIVMMGEPFVGKSNLLLRYCKNKFNEFSKNTIGAELAKKIVNIDDSTISVQVWDTAGQEQYQAVAATYYRGAHAGVIVYDITNVESFQMVSKWLNKFRELLDQDTLCILVGNKLDQQQFRKVDSSQAAEYALNNNLAYFETSALDGTNVQQAYGTLVQKLYDLSKNKNKQQEQNNQQNTKEMKKSVRLQDNQNNGSQAKGNKQCC